jgi:hypothetical protein
MKKIFAFLFLLFSTLCLSQQVSMNETLKMYEYSHVKDFSGDSAERYKLFVNKMRELNYKNVESFDNGLKGENFFTKMIMGSAMEVHFNALIQFKDGKYKLTINNFTIKDVRYGAVALETLGKGAQKRWVNFINEQLPQVVANLENADKW